MRINRSLLNWGVFLIALGGVPLAVQQGWAQSSVAADLLRLWPLILVGIGLGLILRWTPVAWLGGALVAGTFGLLFGALIAGVQGKPITAWQQFMPTLIASSCVGEGSVDTEQTQESGVVSGSPFSVAIDLSCGRLDVDRSTATGWQIQSVHAVDDAPTIDSSSSRLSLRQLFGGDSPFVLNGPGQNRWDVALPTESSLRTDLTLNAIQAAIDLGGGSFETLDGTLNAADVTIDLTDATAPLPAALGLRLNASSLDLRLPQASLSAQLRLNASSLEVCAPEGVGLRVELDDTLGSDDVDQAELSRVGDGWQSADYETATERIDLTIKNTVSSVTLDRAEDCS